MIISTQKNVFNIMASTNANIFIYYLKRIPLIGKLVPEGIYGNIRLKRQLAVIASILKVIISVARKAIYILLTMILPIVMLHKVVAPSQRWEYYLHMFFVMSMFCGSFQTSHIFETNRNKFLCIRLMRMDAKNYIMSTVLFRNFVDTLYFMPSLAISAVVLSGSFKQGLLLTVLFCCFRFIGEAFHLAVYSRTNMILITKTPLVIAFGGICLAAAYVPVFFKRPLMLGSVLMNPLIVTACVALAAICTLIIMKSDQYYKIAEVTLKSTDFTKDTKKIAGQARFSDVAMREKEFTTKDLNSDKFDSKKGFAYLNAIFFERHRRLLVKPILIRLAITAGLFLAAIIVSYFKPNFIKPLSNSGAILPVFVFIMYFASIGDKVCKAMFYNCDISLLRYSFYRDQKAVLSNFKVRLFRLAGLNMIVAATISAAVVGLTFIFKLQWASIDIISFTLSILFLSLFFSVHHLFLYYVFQPYTTELGMKNPFYNIINYGVYFVCYFCMKIKSPPSYFTLIVLMSTLIYIVAALILVFKYAPKTFRVK